MMGDPWLTIIGMPDDSAEALTPASRAAIDAAELIFGGPRHLALVGAAERGRPWPIPFDVEPVLSESGRRVVVLASGDPFWFGVGGTLAATLSPGEWTCLGAPSTFSLVAARLGWRLEETRCLGLHAAPLARLRAALAPKERLISLLRDADAAHDLAVWLTEAGGGEARLWICEKMGGPNERVREAKAAHFDLKDLSAPLAAAIELPDGIGLSRASGLPDSLFASDGQITKRPVRALTLSALAPRKGEHLWDIGAGSGSISIEWCLAGGRATAFERREDRVANIARNIDDFGLGHRMQAVTGAATQNLERAERPDAVFVGGGGDAALFDQLFSLLPEGSRLVANGVTLETECLLIQLQAEKGGELLRIELAHAAPLGGMRGWQPTRPLVQWSVQL